MRMSKSVFDFKYFRRSKTSSIIATDIQMQSLIYGTQHFDLLLCPQLNYSTSNRDEQNYVGAVVQLNYA